MRHCCWAFQGVLLELLCRQADIHRSLLVSNEMYGKYIHLPIGTPESEQLSGKYYQYPLCPGLYYNRLKWNMWCFRMEGWSSTCHFSVSTSSISPNDRPNTAKYVLHFCFQRAMLEYWLHWLGGTKQSENDYIMLRGNLLIVPSRSPFDTKASKCHDSEKVSESRESKSRAPLPFLQANVHCY